MEIRLAVEKKKGQILSLLADTESFFEIVLGVGFCWDLVFPEKDNESQILPFDELIYCTIDGLPIKGCLFIDVLTVLKSFIKDPCTKTDLSMFIRRENDLNTILLIRDNNQDKAISVFDKESGTISFEPLKEYIGASIQLVKQQDDGITEELCRIDRLSKEKDVGTVYFKDI